MMVRAVVGMVVCVLGVVGCSSGQVEGGAPLGEANEGPEPAGCAPGQAMCDDACVDVATNSLHCGACDVVCEQGSYCTEGACALLCGAGQLECNGVCTTVVSDLQNCGACGNACDAGLFCDAGSCTTTCSGIQCLVSAGVECVDPQTNPSHCGGCGNACAPGHSCVDGACVLKCPEELSPCNGSCVNLASDTHHCGFCDNVCDGEPCIGGQCGCGASQTLCAGVCVSTQTDRKNCGGCGTACGDGASCVGGQCVCATDETLCGSACVDTSSDVANCGGCDRPCPTGQVCALGACTGSCPSGTTNCNGSCVDTAASRQNCGACGNVCDGALVCEASQCVCPSGGTLCGTECFDLQNDSQHCGDCTTQCDGGRTCVAGSCQCPTGQDHCGNVCVTVSNNPQHCGGCDQECVDTQSCVSGECECPNEEELCGDACIDLVTANENCGECGNICSGGATCQEGRCLCDNGQLSCGGLCVDAQTSNEHCGGCDNPCPEGRSCVAGECSGIVGDGPDSCSGAAHSIELTKIAMLQGVEVPLMDNGALVNDRNAEVVSQREGVLRLFFDLSAGWEDREVSARFHVTTSGEEHTVFRRQVVSQSSVQGSLDTTIQILVDPTLIGPDSRWWVEIVECEASVGTVLSPRFPASGDVALEASVGGPLKVAFVPVTYSANGSTWEPDTSATTLAAYADYLGAMYPAAEIQTSVTSSISYSAPLDFSVLLDNIRNKRAADNPSADVYYMGLLRPANTMNEYCGFSCTTGMGYVVDLGWQPETVRAAVSVAFGSELTSSTIAHELGHNHGRDHAPCGVTGDASYPYSGGLIGSWGFDRRSNTLQDPSQVADIMSYCSPSWVSDYTYRAFFDRIQQVNGVTSTAMWGAPVPGKWRVALVGPGSLRWGHPIQDPTRPTGRVEAAQVLDATGQGIALVDVYVVETSLQDHETVLVPEPDPSWHSIDLGGRGVLAF